MNVKLFPKIALHRHLEGTIRPSTIFEYREINGLKVNSIEEMKKRMVIDKNDKSLVDFLDKLGTDFMLASTKDKETLTRFAYEAGVDAANDNIKYLELRFCQSNYSKIDLSLSQFIEAVSDGIKQAEKEHDIEISLIIALKRHDPPEANNSLLSNYP